MLKQSSTSIDSIPRNHNRIIKSIRRSSFQSVVLEEEKTWTNLPYYEKHNNNTKMFIDVLESRLKMKEMTKAEREKILGNYFPKGIQVSKMKMLRQVVETPILRLMIFAGP